MSIPAYSQLVLSPKEAEDFNPFEHPEYWKEVQYSNQVPVAVRFTHREDREMALSVMKTLEIAWALQIGKMGFLPPFAADPTGEDKFQVFLIRGLKPAVEVTGPVVRPDVSWKTAYLSYMVVNAWGQYAGSALQSTLQHEFNHALQAADDWNEPGSIFEMSSNFIQEKIRPGENPDYHIEIKDFQSHPEKPVHLYDDYKSYFMYGSYIYLSFLEQNYFSKDPHFLAELWEGARGPATWIDSLNKMLPNGKTYIDTVVEFARWRFDGDRSLSLPEEHPA